MSSTAAPQDQPVVIGEKTNKNFWELLAGGFCDPNKNQDLDDDEPTADETTVPTEELKVKGEAPKSAGAIESNKSTIQQIAPGSKGGDSAVVGTTTVEGTEGKEDVEISEKTPCVPESSSPPVQAMEEAHNDSAKPENEVSKLGGKIWLLVGLIILAMLVQKKQLLSFDTETPKMVADVSTMDPIEPVEAVKLVEVEALLEEITESSESSEQEGEEEEEEEEEEPPESDSVEEIIEETFLEVEEEIVEEEMEEIVEEEIGKEDATDTSAEMIDNEEEVIEDLVSEDPVGDDVEEKVEITESDAVTELTEDSFEENEIMDTEEITEETENKEGSEDGEEDWSTVIDPEVASKLKEAQGKRKSGRFAFARRNVAIDIDEAMVEEE